jgi:uncharacterized membrane protein
LNFSIVRKRFRVRTDFDGVLCICIAEVIWDIDIFLYGGYSSFLVLVMFLFMAILALSIELEKKKKIISLNKKKIISL